MRRFVALAFISLAAGCTTPFTGPANVPDPARDTAPGSAETAAGPAPESSSASGLPQRGNVATAALLTQSRDARSTGDYAGAVIAIERALSIDSNDPGLWVELAEIRLEEGDMEEARTLARKALTLAGADGSVTARAERIAGR